MAKAKSRSDRPDDARQARLIALLTDGQMRSNASKRIDYRLYLRPLSSPTSRSINRGTEKSGDRRRRIRVRPRP
jgi:hypothetical protein